MGLTHNKSNIYAYRIVLLILQVPTIKVLLASMIIRISTQVTLSGLKL